MAKEGYKPTSGMQAAARRAIKYKEQGKARGAGTAVGWTRAGQLARGESLSLDTVKRMYSYFSRHEVDKKGKDWDNSENPSNGKIMWLAWGGDAGFSWSRAIVNREKNKTNKSYAIEIEEEIKSILEDVIDPITEEIDIEKSAETEIYKSDDEDEDKWDNELQKCWTNYKQEGMKEKDGRMVPNCVPVEKVEKMNNDLEKAVKPEVSKETLLEVIKELQEIIVGMVEIEEPETEAETEDPEVEVEDANPAPIGDPEKNDVNWPVNKTEGQSIISEEERRILNQGVKKSLWSGVFDTDFTK